MGKLRKSGQPCPDCGSSDALSIYDNGTYCFSCKKSRIAECMDLNYEVIEKPMTDISYVQDYPSVAMPERGITLEVAQKYGVKAECSESTGMPEKYFFPYYKDSKIV